MKTYRWFTNPRTGGLWAFPRDAGRYANMAERTDHPCKHGHFGCAVWDGGPCSSEETSAARSGKSPDESTEGRATQGERDQFHPQDLNE